MSGSAKGTLMDLHTIPKRTIQAAIDGARLTFGEVTAFNTAFRPRAAIEAFVPHLIHRTPPTAPFDNGVRQPLITASQGFGAGYRFSLPRFAARAIVDATKGFALTGRMTEETVQDVLELWPRLAEFVPQPPPSSPAAEPSELTVGLGIVPTNVVFGNTALEWLVRLDACSAKDSPVKGPLHSLHGVVRQLCSSPRAGNALARALAAEDDCGEGTPLRPLTVYLVPYNRAMDRRFEYRIFCPPGGGGISTVSQYRWTERWASLDSRSDSSSSAGSGDKSSAGSGSKSSAGSIPDRRVSNHSDHVYPDDDLNRKYDPEGYSTEATFDDWRRAERVLRGAEAVYKEIISFAKKVDAQRAESATGKINLASYMPDPISPLSRSGRSSADSMGDETLSNILRRDGFTFNVLEGGPDAKELQLVELNCFGAMSACGSCLFEWIRDAEALYGVQRSGGCAGSSCLSEAPGRVEFRVVK